MNLVPWCGITGVWLCSNATRCIHGIHANFIINYASINFFLKLLDPTSEFLIQYFWDEAPGSWHFGQVAWWCQYFRSDNHILGSTVPEHSFNSLYTATESCTYPILPRQWPKEKKNQASPYPHPQLSCAILINKNTNLIKLFN